MGRLCKFFGFAGLLLAVAHSGFAQQVNTSSGTAVVGNPAVMPVGAPIIITPPVVALPGSGTPVGAPVQVGVNDPRNPSGYVQESGPMVAAPSVLIITPPAVSIPNAPVSVVGPEVAASAGGVSATTNTSGNAAGAAQTTPSGFSTGVTGVQSMSARSGMTVADAAARFKTEKASIRARMITNQDISALNARNSNGVGMNTNNESMPQADVPADQNQSDANSNSNDVLDQRDLNAVNAALARSRAKQAAAEKKQQENAAQPQNPKQ